MPAFMPTGASFVNLIDICRVGLRVQGNTEEEGGKASGSGSPVFKSRVQVPGFLVSSSGSRVSGFGIRISGIGYRNLKKADRKLGVRLRGDPHAELRIDLFEFCDRLLELLRSSGFGIWASGFGFWLSGLRFRV